MVKTASDLDMKKVKYSVGELLVHPRIHDIISYSADLMEDVSLIMKGVLLYEKAEELKSAGLDRVNVSLDVMDPETYERITRDDCVEKVKKGIKKANQVGLYPVKINVLLMKDLNDKSIEDMIEFAADTSSILQMIGMTVVEKVSLMNSISVVIPF